MTKRVLLPKRIRHKMYKEALICYKELNSIENQGAYGMCWCIKSVINKSKVLDRRFVYKDVNALPEFIIHKPKYFHHNEHWIRDDKGRYNARNTKYRIAILEDCIKKSKPKSKRNVNEV